MYGPGARRFHGEIDKVLATKPNNLSYRDFTYFDYMNIGVREKLS